jgi:hypothetical protein
VNSRGIAKFKLATRVGARAIVADYALLDESKPKTITPWPAKQLVLEYYRGGRLVSRAESRFDDVARSGRIVGVHSEPHF